MVIGHWSLVKRLRLRKGERRQGDRRQETVSTTEINRSNLPLRHQEYCTGFRVCDLEFVIWDLEFGICDLEFRFCDLELGFWDFSHLAVLGELGGLFFQD